MWLLFQQESSNNYISQFLAFIVVLIWIEEEGEFMASAHAVKMNTLAYSYISRHFVSNLYLALYIVNVLKD